uniref:hypothetical protein n=1 Tax=Nonomuraea sp. CA-251285 TaxID=3240002 RepID=UPI003F496BD6
MSLVYDHRFRQDPEDPEECRVCGDAKGDRPGLHKGEIAPLGVPDGLDEDTLAYLIRLVRAAFTESSVAVLEGDLDILARRAVLTLHGRGAIKPRRSTWRPPAEHG